MLPKKLWAERWIQPPPLGFIPIFFDDERVHAIFKTASEIQREGIVSPGLQVKGTNEQELAAELIVLMRTSIQSGDWTKILSPDRHFMQYVKLSPLPMKIIEPCYNRVDDQDNYVSSGPGLEQSTMTEVFHQFFEEREDEFCTTLYEDYTTLQCMDLQISPSKHEELVLFGAVTALALVYGHYPGHLNPLLLIYLLNNCDLSCLHRDLVSSYLPSVSEMLDRWLNLGPTDSIGEFASHFASYHNIQVQYLYRILSMNFMTLIIFYRQVGVLNGRSEAGHQKLASEMLHNVVIGPVGVENAYFAAFIKGFLLPGATGFTLADVSVTYMDIFSNSMLSFRLCAASLEDLKNLFELPKHQ